MNPSVVKWSSKQMGGLAEGLAKVHVCKVMIPLSPVGAGNVRIQAGGEELKVQSGEEWFGRHGDIKPENVLFFETENVLKLADFGLGRFHGRDSRSKVNPETITFTSTYEPPEVKIGKAVSREYDIWSLGCLYLEFATWLLKGFQAIEKEFVDCRLEPHDGLDAFHDDSFYSIIKHNGEKQAKIREGVNKWVVELHQDERCSQFIHDLLDLVMNEMLLVNSKKRIKAKDLPEKFGQFQIRAEQNEGYISTPRPRPRPQQTTSLMPNAKKKTVRWDGDSRRASPGDSTLGCSPPRTGTNITIP